MDLVIKSKIWVLQLDTKHCRICSTQLTATRICYFDRLVRNTRIVEWLPAELAELVHGTKVQSHSKVTNQISIYSAIL